MTDLSAVLPFWKKKKKIGEKKSEILYWQFIDLFYFKPEKHLDSAELCADGDRRVCISLHPHVLNNRAVSGAINQSSGDHFIGMRKIFWAFMWVLWIWNAATIPLSNNPYSLILLRCPAMHQNLIQFEFQKPFSICIFFMHFSAWGCAAFQALHTASAIKRITYHFDGMNGIVLLFFFHGNTHTSTQTSCECVLDFAPVPEAVGCSDSMRHSV